MRNRFLAVVGAVAALSLAWPALIAQITIPNSFTNGTVADPDAVNANFTALGTQALNRAGGTMTAQLNVQNLTPTTDATYTVGDISHRFASGYFSGALTALSFAGSGAGLTTLNASTLSTGTVPAARAGSGTPDVSTFLRGDSTWSREWSSIIVTTTGTVNDWAPGLVGNTIILCNNTSLLTINGMAGAFDGQLVQFFAVNTGQVDFAHEAVGSTASYRLGNFATSGITSILGGTATYQYQSIRSRWALVQHEQGGWIQPAFSAANYTNNNGTGWTVTGGNEVARAYHLRGHEMSVSVAVIATAVGSGATCLRTALPGTFTATKLSYGANTYYDNGVPGVGLVRAQAVSPTFIEFCKADQAATWTPSAGSTNIYATLSFEVN